MSQPPVQPIRVGGKSALAQFSCEKCGAKLEYAPGTKVLRCRYCTHENVIPDVVDEAGAELTVRENDFAEALTKLAGVAPMLTVGQIECGACKAVFTPAPNTTATSCPFCGANIVLTQHSATIIKPNAVLPFKLAREEATELYRHWVSSRWFAPTKLKTRALLDATLRGIYIPAWTYDTATTSRYRGERGDAYYVTVGSGNNRRTERRIRWSSTSGVVSNIFDDVLVLGSQSLPVEKAKALEPWDLHGLTPYEDSYLAGFTAESYTIGLADGFEAAKGIMDGIIRATVRRDIGGDEQQISSLNTSYADITFKHILLPIWLSAYRFHEKTYRFLVNARTGEVQGERPYSWIKITLAVLAALAIISIIALVASNK